MTKQSKSGVEIKDTHYDNRNADNHLGEKFETVGAEHKWIGQEIEATSDPLIDSGTGRPVIIRMFEFAANPEVLKREKPTKQQLFNSHAAQIKSFLWRDGLQPYEAVSPKVTTSKKREKYRIFVTCEPRPGVVLAEKTHTLQELTTKNAT